MMKLRDYQEACVTAAWRALFTKNHVLCVGPPGVGKTECFIELCRRSVKAKSDVRILILLNKVMLVEQTARRIDKAMGGSVGVYCGSLNERELKNITVASVQSLHKEDSLGMINLVIVDEAHNLSEKEDSYYQLVLKKLKHEKLKVIGFTATPYRAKGLLYGKSRFFDRIDYQIEMQSMIDQGYLVKPLLKHSEHQFTTKGIKITNGDFDQGELAKLVDNETLIDSQINDALSRLEGRKKVVWACVNIDHADRVWKKLYRIDQDAVVVHSKQKKAENDDAKEEFEEEQSCRHLVFVTMLSEGIDIPAVDALVMMRPTRSPTRYVQTVGRVLRPFEGKDSALVLDYGEVVKNLGPLDDPAVSKEGERAKDKVDHRMKFCKVCLSYVPMNSNTCPDCGAGFGIKKDDTPAEIKLSRAADGESILLKVDRGKVKNECIVNSVTAGFYRSKSGNNCIRLAYIVADILGTPIYEYFLINQEWAKAKLRARLEVMESPIKDVDALVAEVYVDRTKTVEMNRIPSRIVYSHDVSKGFYEIKRLIFDEKPNRGSDNERHSPLLKLPDGIVCVEK